MPCVRLPGRGSACAVAEQMAITDTGTLKPVSEFSAKEKWWCDGEDCDGWPLTAPHVHPMGAPARAVDLLTGREIERFGEGCSCPGDCEGSPECLDDEGGPLEVHRG
jgi:hypothetical protein